MNTSTSNFLKIFRISYLTFPQLDIKLIFNSSHKVASFCNHKDNTSNALRSSVVYKFICGNCNVAYVGSTLRQLSIRTDYHKGVSTLTNSLLNCPSHSAIRDHSHTHDYPFNNANFSIL